MILQIEAGKLKTLADVEAFMAAHGAGEVAPPGRAAACAHIGKAMARCAYWKQGRAAKGLLLRYLLLTTGLSESQLTLLIARYLAEGAVEDRRRGPARGFRRVYTRADVVLLAETDALHGKLSGPATRKIMERAWKLFGDARFERLAGISNGHPYNLRRHRSYERLRGSRGRTRPVSIPIGERRRPRPEGRPGYLRVDTVHQGDLGRAKGLYHVNAVDEVTQYEFIGTVERIAESFLLPVLEELLAAFPFPIRGLHSDNGSAYVNYRVAGLLERLRAEFTRSRARRSNDNALAEAKNGGVVRRYLGCAHIPARHAARLHEFTFGVLSPFLNFHRPCYFAKEKADGKGKIKKIYRCESIDTPYERLQALAGAEGHLRAGVTFGQLDREAHAQTDNEAAEGLNAAWDRLLRELRAEGA